MPRTRSTTGSVERPLRLKSQITRRAIETLRFVSGDEALRSEIYGRWGDKLYDQFAKLRPEIEAWLKGDGGEDQSDDGDDAGDDEDSKPVKKSVPEKRRKKLLDPATWLRDMTLVELARLAQRELGDGVFDDHNDFRTRFDAAMNGHGKKPSAVRTRKPYTRP